MKSPLRSSLLAVAFATTAAVAVAGCGEDSPAEPQGKAGSGGSSAGSAGRSGAGGTSRGGTTGQAGEGAEAGTGGDAGAKGGKAGRGGSSGAVGGSSQGGRGGSSAESGRGGTAGNTTDGGAAGAQAGEGGSGPAPGCSTSEDECPSGSYCAVAGGECVPGCKNDGACASGRCTEARDCEQCVRDDECAGGRVCGNGVCHAPCGTAPLSECGSSELDCCGSRCVETNHDVQNCGGCGIVCSDSAFCSSEGCADVTFANVCKVRSVVVLINEQPGDAAPARALGEALAAGCVPSPPVVEVNEADATMINPATGQPLAGGDMLALAGGPFGHDVIRYLDAQRRTPVYSSTDGAIYEIRRADTDAVLVSFSFTTVGSAHDYLVIEVARDAVTGALAVISYGFTEYGTAAAVWYFANVVLPDFATREGTYYVLEWTDDGDATPDAGDEFALIQSGP